MKLSNWILVNYMTYSGERHTRRVCEMGKQVLTALMGIFQISCNIQLYMKIDFLNIELALRWLVWFRLSCRQNYVGFDEFAKS